MEHYIAINNRIDELSPEHQLTVVHFINYLAGASLNHKALAIKTIDEILEGGYTNEYR
jgi:hypothetical protein